MWSSGVYFERVDSSGHEYGPNSDQVKDIIKQVDAELVVLLDMLDEASNINVMVFSDHGMIERRGALADASLGLINVLDYINSSDWQHVAGSQAAPVLQIWPKPDKEEWVCIT